MRDEAYQNPRFRALSHAAQAVAHHARIAQLCSDSLELHAQGHQDIEPVYLTLRRIAEELTQISTELQGMPQDNPWQYLLPFLSKKGGDA